MESIIDTSRMIKIITASKIDSVSLKEELFLENLGRLLDARKQIAILILNNSGNKSDHLELFDYINKNINHLLGT